MGYFEEKYPSIVTEIEKGQRTFFRALDSDVIIIGRKNHKERWILEGKYSAGENYQRKTYSSQSEVKFSVIFITELTAFEGKIDFSATPLQVDGPIDWHLIAILQPCLNQDLNAIQQNFTEDIRNAYTTQIILHEMNHVLTNEYVTENGELNHFKSELLADCFLLQEINRLPNRQIQLDIKRTDVRLLLSNHSWNSKNQYYKLYLTVVNQLLNLSEMSALSIKIAKLQEILMDSWDGTVSDLSDKLLAEVQTHQ